MRAVLLILAISLSSPAAAQVGNEISQHPSAKPSDKNSPQKERGTEEAPFFAKIVHPEKTPQELQQEETKKREEADERARKAQADDNIVKLTGDLALYTKLLFIATGFLVVVTGALVYVGFRQVRDAKDSIAAAVKSANAAEKSANAAETQIAVVSAQNDTIEKQFGVTRTQFVMAHRPRLRIRSISIARQIGPDGVTPSPMFEGGRPIVGSLAVVNTGETNAKILASAYRFYWTTHGLPMEPPWVGGKNVLPLFNGDPSPLEGRESRSIQIRSIDSMNSAEADFVQRDQQLCRLYLMGVIRYADTNFPPKEQLMGFCREYIPARDNVGEGFFRPVDNPDYEYED